MYLSAEECYDPFSPEVVHPEDHRNDEPEAKLRSGSPMDVGAMELELVNRAIEAVQSEVEREKRKLSHMGDQKYEPTTSSSTEGPKRKKPVPVASHQGYDPGSYQMTQGTDYSPTPRSNKYILDSESENTHGSSMEYVPTAVSKTSTKKSSLFSRTSQTSGLPSNPQSTTSVKSKYTLDTPKSHLDSESEDNHGSSLEYIPTAVSKTSAKKSLLFSLTSHTSNIPLSPQSSTSGKNKYTLDTSKPLTDMEYDPLSNYSAKLARQNKDQRTLSTDTETKKASPPTSKRKQSVDEEYVPTVKKQRPQQPVVDSQKYSACFSESDGESSGTEYRPMLISHLKQRKNARGSTEDGARTSSEDKNNVVSSSRVLKQQGNQNSKPEEGSSQGDSEDPDECLERERPKEKFPEKKAKDRDKDIQKKSSKNGDAKREEKRPSGKSSGEKERTGSSSSDKKKKLSSESIKKTEKTNDKGRQKEKEAHKSRKEEKSSDGKSKRPEKVRSDSTHKEKERSGEVKKQKSDKTHERDLTKYKDQKNGKLHLVGKEKDKTKSSQGSLSVSKDKSKKSSSSSSSKSKASREKQRSLSHVDLFGDESGEEAEQDEEEEDEEEEIIVRKSAAAHRRTGLLSSKKDAVDRGRSFSEEDVGQEDDQSDDDDDVDDGGVDYSSLQDVDYDSDPLEECLRIFNESKDVKTEDKGRQAKQVLSAFFCWHCLFTLVSVTCFSFSKSEVHYK